MAELQTYTPKVSTTAVISLDLDELRALDALTGYGVDQLIAHFYKHMGVSYLKPYEHGLRSFLKAAAQAGSTLSTVDQMQRELDELRVEKGRRKVRAQDHKRDVRALELARETYLAAGGKEDDPRRAQKVARIQIAIGDAMETS